MKAVVRKASKPPPDRTSPVWEASKPPPDRTPPVWEPCFLAALERTGCVRVAAEAAGVTARGAQKRRLREPAFAAAWGLALRVWRAERAAALMAAEVAAGTGISGSHRTAGKVARVRTRAGAGVRISDAAEGAFLDMLCATANVRLAAKAAGASAAAFYRRRLRDPRFGEAWDAALDTGRADLEMKLVEAACRTFEPDRLRMMGFDEDEAVRAGLAPARLPPTALPNVTIDEAIRILGQLRGKRPGARPSFAELERRGEEARAQILWKLGNIARHAKREKERAEREKERAEREKEQAGREKEQAGRKGASA